MPISERDYMKRPPPPPRMQRIYRRLPSGSQGFTAMWAIIAVNFMMYIATLIAPQLIYSSFGLTPALFLKQPWTIITSMFVHGGFGHLLGNMLTLYFFGTSFARMVGENKFLMVYFAGGILGNILFILLGPSFSMVVGASGAVYAVAGALVVLRPKVRVLLYFIVPMPLWLVVCVFFVIWSFIPGIAWQAHLGGLVLGLISGYIFKRKMPYFYL